MAKHKAKKKKKSSRKWLKGLKNWTNLNDTLMDWSIKDLIAMLFYEKNNKNRSTFITRLKQRLKKAQADDVNKNV